MLATYTSLCMWKIGYESWLTYRKRLKKGTQAQDTPSGASISAWSGGPEAVMLSLFGLSISTQSKADFLDWFGSDIWSGLILDWLAGIVKEWPWLLLSLSTGRSSNSPLCWGIFSLDFPVSWGVSNSPGERISSRSVSWEAFLESSCWLPTGWIWDAPICSAWLASFISSKSSRRKLCWLQDSCWISLNIKLCLEVCTWFEIYSVMTLAVLRQKGSDSLATSILQAQFYRTNHDYSTAINKNDSHIESGKHGQANCKFCRDWLMSQKSSYLLLCIALWRA